MRAISVCDYPKLNDNHYHYDIDIHNGTHTDIIISMTFTITDSIVH